MRARAGSPAPVPSPESGPPTSAGTLAAATLPWPRRRCSPRSTTPDSPLAGRRDRTLRHGPGPPQRPGGGTGHPAPQLLGRMRPGRVAPCAMVGQAVGAILSGQASTVVVFRALNGRSGRRYGAAPTAAGQAITGGRGPTTSSSCRTDCSRRADVRPDGPAAHDPIRFTREQLASIAIACRDRALEIRPRRCTAARSRWTATCRRG